MTEKEERIFITKITPECKFRELHETTAGGHTWVDFMCGKSNIKNLECDEKCLEKCEIKELTGISRQEAIERMANALSLVQAKTFVDEIQWERVMNGCRYEAEAALNELLEGGK